MLLVKRVHKPIVYMYFCQSFSVSQPRVKVSLLITIYFAWYKFSLERINQVLSPPRTPLHLRTYVYITVWLWDYCPCMLLDVVRVQKNSSEIVLTVSSWLLTFNAKKSRYDMTDNCTPPQPWSVIDAMPLHVDCRTDTNMGWQMEGHSKNDWGENYYCLFATVVSYNLLTLHK